MADEIETTDNIPIEINDLVQARLVGGEGTTGYKSRVDDIVDKKLILDWPTDAGIRMPVRKNQTLALIFVRQDAVYSIEGIVDNVVTNPAPKITVQPLGTTQRIQRRSYFRVRTALPVQLTGTIETKSSTGEKKESVLHLMTHTVDLSGAGMAIFYKSPLPTGSVFDVKLTIEEGKPPIKMIARVVHSEPAGRGSGQPLYHTGFYFLAVSEAQRTLLVRHVFRVQQRALSQ